MSDDSIQRALLPYNPNANALQRKPSEGAKRFRRCRSVPGSETDQNPISPKELFAATVSFRLVGFLMFLYLLVGVIVFYLVMDQLSGKRTNRVLDAFYFCIVTMTSGGNGDLVPNSDTAKLLDCVFVFTGMAIIALLVTKSADYLVEKQEVLLSKALPMNMEGGEAKMLGQIETNRTKHKFYTAALLVVAAFVVGIVFLWKVEKLSLLDSLITTLGYGDESFSSELGRVFAVFWILTSTIIQALFFMYLAEIYAERRQKVLVKWVLTRRMTTMDLEAADLDNDGKVGAAEFVVYKLKELGKISQEDISSILEQFDILDVDQSGMLCSDDLTLAQSGQ